jgi:adenylosuccinate synthase
MTLRIVVGTQWGDEGKGRITDILAPSADIVARFGGGDNAGHTIVTDKGITKLHLIPAGILHDGVTSYIARGVVINPFVLLDEVERLRNDGYRVDPERLKISNRAQVVTPAHIALDKAQELARGSHAIGTTLRGIGPAFVDRTGRSGLAIGMFSSPAETQKVLETHLKEKNIELRLRYNAPELEVESIVEDFLALSSRLAPFLVEDSHFVVDALTRNCKILAEGTQGIMLDLDHGSYPYVTSSNTTAPAALVSLGIGPKEVESVIGVAKSFTTRVGEGPLPTELFGESALRLRGTGNNQWDEFGVTTGRPRRVGWLDLKVLEYATRVNGLDYLALTKLDILSGLEEIPVCVAYEMNGERLKGFPAESSLLQQCKPIYEILSGWESDITNTKKPEDLPKNARRFVEFVEDQIKVPVMAATVGPHREQTIWFIPAE